NEHFRPHNKAVIGNMNDIRLAAISDVIPDGTNFTFDLELENISDSNSNMWVSGVTVLDDTAANITAVTTTYPAPLALDALNTFTANPPDDLVTVRSTGHGLSEGDVVYMNGVTGPFVDNIPVGDINGQAFRIVNVTANTFDIEVVGSGAVTTGVAVNETGNAQQSYATQGAGTKGRTGSNGDITLDLSGNLASSFYTVQLDVMVEDDNGNLTSSTISYRVENGATNNMNNRYDARLVAPSGANPGGALEAPTTTRAILRAELVNEEGIAVGPGEEGYLRIVGQEDPFNPESYYSVAIDDSSSREIGRPNLTPPEVGSNWGFSHYFGLNDFFVANEHTTTGDTVAGSALNMVVRQDIIDNPNLISMGTLTSTPDPVTGYPNYSVERTIGDNSVAQRLSGLGISQVTFDSAGGLPQTTKTFNGYASEILGYLSSKTASAVARSEDDQILLDGFTERMDAISGVNIDEEMANTIIFQNAYNASAQVIRTVKELFDTLLASF
ncbi:MAG: flagellar basal body rod C-terminal domain-containing protein, partial [Rickettsiales bacterium]